MFRLFFLNRVRFSSLTKSVFSQINSSESVLNITMHSSSVTHNYNAMKVKVLPALSDNYMYLLIDQKTNEAAVVDPVEPAAVVQAAYEENIYLTTVLTTHHHSDHAGGNAELIKKMKEKKLVIVGGDERVQSVSKIVKDEDDFKLGSLTIKCLHTPCHTTGHICYYVTSPTADCPVVFTGDTLFIAGCGRFFEGTSEMMNVSLNKKLAELPDETKVFCGHEYTSTNLKFAKTVEPSNEDVKRKFSTVIELRSKNQPTVPSTIGEEKKINPFMRVSVQSVQDYAKSNDIIQTMTYLRKQKDGFK